MHLCAGTRDHTARQGWGSTLAIRRPCTAAELDPPSALVGICSRGDTRANPYPGADSISSL